jgi:hypothetical protein
MKDDGEAVIPIPRNQLARNLWVAVAVPHPFKAASCSSLVSSSQLLHNTCPPRLCHARCVLDDFHVESDNARG